MAVTLFGEGWVVRRAQQMLRDKKLRNKRRIYIEGKRARRIAEEAEAAAARAKESRPPLPHPPPPSAKEFVPKPFAPSDSSKDTPKKTLETSVCEKCKGEGKYLKKGTLRNCRTCGGSGKASQKD